MASVARALAVWMAVVGFCLPAELLAAEFPQMQTPVVADVVLHEGGVLLGQVVNPQGVALPDVNVSLRRQDAEVAVTATNASGHFAFRGVGGGVYQLVAAEGQGAYRAWTPMTAPPTAMEGALLVAGGTTVRGRCCNKPLPVLLANPWVVAAIVGTAIAVPVAIHNSQGGPSSP